MLARTSAHKYEVEACFELKGENTSAGLVASIMMRIIILDLVFNQKGQLLRYRRGQVSRTESKISSSKPMWKDVAAFAE